MTVKLLIKPGTGNGEPEWRDLLGHDGKPRTFRTLAECHDACATQIAQSAQRILSVRILDNTGNQVG